MFNIGVTGGKTRSTDLGDFFQTRALRLLLLLHAYSGPPSTGIGHIARFIISASYAPVIVSCPQLHRAIFSATDDPRSITRHICAEDRPRVARQGLAVRPVVR